MVQGRCQEWNGLKNCFIICRYCMYPHVTFTSMDFAMSFLLFPPCSIKEIPYLCLRIKFFVFTTDFVRRFDEVK